MGSAGSPWLDLIVGVVLSNYFLSLTYHLKLCVLLIKRASQVDDKTTFILCWISLSFIHPSTALSQEILKMKAVVAAPFFLACSVSSLSLSRARASIDRRSLYFANFQHFLLLHQNRPVSFCRSIL
jgi:hypothetical protein